MTSTKNDSSIFTIWQDPCHFKSFISFVINQASKLVPVTSHWPVQLSCLTSKYLHLSIIHDQWVNFFFSQKNASEISLLFWKMLLSLLLWMYSLEKSSCLAPQNTVSIMEIYPTETLTSQLQCHTNAQYLVAHSSPSHSLLVSVENNCSVCHCPNTELIISHAQFVQWPFVTCVLGYSEENYQVGCILMIRKERVSFFWQKVDHEWITSTSKFFFHNTTKKQWNCWKMTMTIASKIKES